MKRSCSVKNHELDGWKKEIRNTNKIFLIEDDMGTVHRTHEGVSNVAVNFFENSQGRSVNVDKIPEDLDLPNI